MVRAIWLVLSIGCTAAIAYLSLINLADTAVSEMGIGDKAMHAGAYFVLTSLWISGWMKNTEKSNFLVKNLIICFLCVIFGIFIEVLQDKMTTYRSFDYYDMLANSLGVIIAGILFWYIKLSFNKLKR